MNLEIQNDKVKKTRAKTAQDKKTKEEVRIAEHNAPNVLALKWREFIKGAAALLHIVEKLQKQ